MTARKTVDPVVKTLGDLRAFVAGTPRFDDSASVILTPEGISIDWRPAPVEQDREGWPQ